jgi:hypothetical protein
MHFRFRPTDETVEAGVRRIACQEIDAALTLVRAAALPPGRIVHRVRRSCKAVRGLLRLVRPAFPAFAHENAAFRDIGRALAGARDGAVLRDTLDGLAGAPDLAVDARTLAALRRRFAAQGGADAAAAALDECARRLLAARVRAASWPVNAQGWEAIGPGLRRTYRAARRAMTALAREGDAHLSHEWRKQVKYHWQHMRLLDAVAPLAGERARRAEQLGEVLGDRHDIDLFVERLAQVPARALPARQRGALLAAAQARAARLDGKARKLGERLFDEKPGDFAAGWEARWHDWARGGLREMVAA